MGIEYSIVCEPEHISRFDAFLRGHSYFESYNAERKTYNMRGKTTAPNSWPDCYVALETNSVYFCDNLRDAEAASIILRSLVDQVLVSSEAVIVRES